MDFELLECFDKDKPLPQHITLQNGMICKVRENRLRQEHVIVTVHEAGTTNIIDSNALLLSNVLPKHIYRLTQQNMYREHSEEFRMYRLPLSDAEDLVDLLIANAGGEDEVIPEYTYKIFGKYIVRDPDEFRWLRKWLADSMCTFTIEREQPHAQFPMTVTLDASGLTNGNRCLVQEHLTKEEMVNTITQVRRII